MRVCSRRVRLQDATVMYLTLLATLVVLLVASYQAPPPTHRLANNQLTLDAALPNPVALVPPLTNQALSLDAPLAYGVPLDPAGRLALRWNVSYERQEVLMQVKTDIGATERQRGVLLGMSDRGDIRDADLVVLWYNGTHTCFGDAYTDHQGAVSLDPHQDYQLLDARYTSGNLTLTFKRKLSTCDIHDYTIEEGTVHFIYAMLDQPIRSLDGLNLSLLDTGVQRVLLLRPDTPAPPLPPGTHTLDVLNPNVIIPTQETTYWCYTHTLPPGFQKKHILMYEAVVSKSNEAIVHHMEVFECDRSRDEELERLVPYSGSCEDKMKPKQLNACRHVLAAWAMGAEPFYYPEDVGLPFGGEESSRFLRLEVHYHNPLLIAGRRDSSGVRLHYTSALRRFDAGIMELGLVYTPLMAIPPQQGAYTLTGYCTQDCTHTALPQGGISIFASQLHTHLAGLGVRTVLVRGGRELEVVQEDKHFSTHYQTIRMLRKMVNVRPGDALITKCTYNTEGRNNPTVGGFGIMEEMCVNYVHYYPRTQLELCKSHVDPAHLQKYFSLVNRYNGIDSCNNLDVTGQYSSVPWDSFSSDVLNALYTSAPIYMHCNQSTAKLFPGDWERVPLPRVHTELKREPYPCEEGL